MSRAVVAGLLALIWTALCPAAASASIAFVQTGTEATGAGASITATLPAASTAGDLLVATVADRNAGCTTDNFTAPAGWVKAEHACRAGTATGPIEIWYYPNVSAGITSVVFNTGSTGANSVAQLSEWSGVATSGPLDTSGTATNSSSSTSLAVTTTGTLSASGELAITGFATSTGLSSFTPGTTWTSLRSDPGGGFASDYLLNPTSGSTLSETITSNPQTNYGAVIATFRSTACSGGSLTVAAPSSLSFGGVTLNGYNSSLTTTLSPTADDETGAGSGWQLDATSTTLTSSGQTLPSTATTITAVSSSAATGNCSMPTNPVSYPVTLPAGVTPPTAISLFSAAVATGKGPVNLTITANVAIPGNARAGSYTSTWTLTMASGP